MAEHNQRPAQVVVVPPDLPAAEVVQQPPQEVVRDLPNAEVVNVNATRSRERNSRNSH
jgi:hypothetical protein